jgi:phosphomannose isomerase type I
MGIVENGALAGQRLDDIYKEYKGELTGKKVYEKYPNKFPLLIKYLDVNDRLSIQVHPSDEVALKKHNEFGKSESWYIMEASDDATLILGMKPGVTKEKFLEKVKKNDFDGLFEEKSVKKGDFIDITPGTVHASLKGSVIFAEIQQNSDVTYRIYDFDRIDKNGKKRELHLQDSADVIDFGKEVEIKNTDFDESENEKDILRKNIIEKEYYSIDKIRFNGSFEDVNNESMTIYSFLEGEGKIVWGENEELSAKKGETILIPAGIKTKTVGKFEILRTII